MNTRRGMTLVEVVASIAILGVIGAVMLPLFHAAADGYAASREARRAIDDASFAMDRVLRLLRDVPGNSIEGTVELESVSSDQVLFADGRGVRFAESALWLLSPGHAPAPILQEVSDANFVAIADDGVTATYADPAATQRFEVRFTCAGLRLHGLATVRVRSITPEGS